RPRRVPVRRSRGRDAKRSPALWWEIYAGAWRQTPSFRGAPKARTRNPEIMPESVSGFRARRCAAPRNDRLAPIRPARGLALVVVGLLPVALPVGGGADAVDGRRAGDGRGLRGIEHHQRALAFARLLDRLPQQAAIGNDRLVRRTEMLLGAILDRAHRLAGPLVVHVDVGAHARIGLVFLLVRIEAV